MYVGLFIACLAFSDFCFSIDCRVHSLYLPLSFGVVAIEMKNLTQNSGISKASTSHFPVQIPNAVSDPASHEHPEEIPGYRHRFLGRQKLNFELVRYT